MLEGLKNLTTKMFGNKEENPNASHIDIKYLNGEFVVKGRVNWGFAGVCINEDYEKDNSAISVKLNEEDLIDVSEYKKLAPGMRELFEAEKGKIDGDKAAKLITKYYNSVLEELDQCQTQLTNYILYQLLTFLWDTAYPFWENGRAIKEGYSEVDESVYTKELSKAIDEVSTDLNDITDYHGTKTIKDYQADVRGVFEKHLPMFDVDALEKAIVKTGCCFSIRGIELQFSDSWKNEFFCCAYEKFVRGLAPIDWHNF